MYRKCPDMFISVCALRDTFKVKYVNTCAHREVSEIAHLYTRKAHSARVSESHIYIYISCIPIPVTLYVIHVYGFTFLYFVHMRMRCMSSVRRLARVLKEHPIK